jgi:hypothetical protein
VDEIQTLPLGQILSIAEWADRKLSVAAAPLMRIHVFNLKSRVATCSGSFKSASKKLTDGLKNSPLGEG